MMMHLSNKLKRTIMKIRKSILADILGTIESVNNNDNDKWWSKRPNKCKTYIISLDSDGGEALSIEDVMLLDEENSTICAKMLSIIHRYATHCGLQSLQSAKYAVGMWVAECGFSEASISEAKQMIDIYKHSLKESVSAIIVFDESTQIFDI